MISWRIDGNYKNKSCIIWSTVKVSWVRRCSRNDHGVQCTCTRFKWSLFLFFLLLFFFIDVALCGRVHAVETVSETIFFLGREFKKKQVYILWYI